MQRGNHLRGKNTWHSSHYYDEGEGYTGISTYLRGQRKFYRSYQNHWIKQDHNWKIQEPWKIYSISKCTSQSFQCDAYPKEIQAIGQYVMERKFLQILTKIVDNNLQPKFLTFYSNSMVTSINTLSSYRVVCVTFINPVALFIFERNMWKHQASYNIIKETSITFNLRKSSMTSEKFTEKKL